jgi:hypothetical protein
MIIPKKTIYKAIGSVIALLILIGIGFALKYWVEHRPKDGPSQRAVRFIKLDGRVTVKHAGNGAALPATLDIALEQGDAIQTSTDASATVEYSNGSVYTIRPGSTIILQNFDNSSHVVNKIENGGVRVKSEGPDTIITPNTKVDTEKGTRATLQTAEGKDTIVVGTGTAKFLTNSGEKGTIGADELVKVDKGVVSRGSMPRPTLAEPQNAKQFLLEPDSDINLTWKPVPDTSRYNVEISSSISFPQQGIMVNPSGLNETKFTWHKPPQGSFFWHVQAVNKDGVEGEWSEPFTFAVQIKKAHGELPLRITRTYEINFFLVEIEGVTKPGALVTINDKQIEVDAGGKFTAEVTFPRETRQRVIVIDAKDANGNSKTINQKL